MKDKLNERQKRFCDYYMQSLNATESAIKAGYNPKNAKCIGWENLQKPSIIEYIGSTFNSLDKERIMKTNEVLELLTKIARGQEKDQMVVSVGDNIITKKVNVSVRDRLKALELMGKSQALFIERREESLKAEDLVINVFPASSKKEETEDGE